MYGRINIARRLSCLLLLCICCSASAAARTDTDLDRAWRDFLEHDAGLAPSYTFPHSHCFTRAANANGLPE
ncbi:MAG: hypothetical protein ACE5FS_16010, partial [Paracoccaceae bacterium]